ncbi:hypothetical protein MsAg5_08350 [Methanosarcinaceae archaeon Ag5]|uniref:Uncharacterized protein n=1 Tax=Methanolapillus africanus TaxID=3028297 RepID=A0AAE4MI20_9EURY|nr:hypothetical protein [Methanosarcinaceae archaeon Ag5]
MKLKIVFVGLILLMSVLAAGCLDRILDESGEWQPPDYVTDKPISVDNTGIKTKHFGPGAAETVPEGTIRAYVMSNTFTTIDYISYDPVDAIKESDVVIYGTVKEIQCSWATSNGAAPFIGEVQTYERTNYSTNETYTVQQVEVGAEIQTFIYFTVDERVKGDCPDEINLWLPGGQMDNLVMYGLSSYTDYPASWDFKPGEQYFLCLKEYSDEYDLVGPYGVRPIVS